MGDWASRNVHDLIFYLAPSNQYIHRQHCGLLIGTLFKDQTYLYSEEKATQRLKCGCKIMDVTSQKSQFWFLHLGGWSFVFENNNTIPIFQKLGRVWINFQVVYTCYNDFILDMSFFTYYFCSGKFPGRHLHLLELYSYGLETTHKDTWNEYCIPL